MRGVNGARGEVAATLGGSPVRLCLTLGALAEIETALRLDKAESLAERLKAVTARDVAGILHALLKGGGMTDAEASALVLRAAPDEAARAVADAFAAAAHP